MDTSKAQATTARELALKISAAEFISRLQALSDEERIEFSFRPRLNEGKSFISKIECHKFRISHRLKFGPFGFVRVIHGQLCETVDGTVLRYHLAVRKELRAVSSLICAIYAMVFLVLLYAEPPKHGEEYMYVLPLLLPLLVASLMIMGVRLRRDNEKGLIDFVSKLANGELSGSD